MQQAGSLPCRPRRAAYEDQLKYATPALVSISGGERRLKRACASASGSARYGSDSSRRASCSGWWSPSSAAVYARSSSHSLGTYSGETCAISATASSLDSRTSRRHRSNHAAHSGSLRVCVEGSYEASANARAAVSAGTSTPSRATSMSTRQKRVQSMRDSSRSPGEQSLPTSASETSPTRSSQSALTSSPGASVRSPSFRIQRACIAASSSAAHSVDTTCCSSAAWRWIVASRSAGSAVAAIRAISARARDTRLVCTARGCRRNPKAPWSPVHGFHTGWNCCT
mmetsp:Transcript_3611/g.8962  ORF Transcript_3611/g.8962 Transcript_3611/m.8962 type:complete len:284 (-) Transcript_3611:1975-2826(-)